MTPAFSTAGESAIPIDVITTASFDKMMTTLDPFALKWVQAAGFKAKLGQVCILPANDGGVRCVLAGWGDNAARARGRFHMATIVAKLPDGNYRINSGLDADARYQAALAWLLSQYRFDRYKAQSSTGAQLVCPNGIDAAQVLTDATATFLARDLINTPASDMGPDALESAFFALAMAHKARVSAITGADLLKETLPMIHAVGRASDQAPRLLDMIWGNPDAPKITLVGKGVCFDTGGLNIKPGSSMGLMKKDMGGAANVLGLAQMIMSRGLNVRLRVLVPAVENSISAGAFRPQDILTSRKGLTVEINNTDAEGRVVLADALALADEENPDLLVCMATLTGAARVALGPDVPPFYTDDDTLADEIAAAAKNAADPAWRMPFWEPYEEYLEPGIADLDNAPSRGQAGSVTAALFLRRFVEHAKSFVHLDVYGWTPAAKPGRPKGGEAQCIRAMLRVIEGRTK